MGFTDFFAARLAELDAAFIRFAETCDPACAAKVAEEREAAIAYVASAIRTAENAVASATHYYRA